LTRADVEVDLAKVSVSAVLRRLTGGAAETTVPGATLGQVIANLEALYPGFLEGVTRGDRLKPGVSAIVDGRGVGDDLDKELGENAEVHFLFLVAGGCEWHIPFSP